MCLCVYCAHMYLCVSLLPTQSAGASLTEVLGVQLLVLGRLEKKVGIRPSAGSRGAQEGQGMAKSQRVHQQELDNE